MPTRRTLNPELKRALVHHQQGRLNEAETLYNDVLAREPENPVALHYLGLLLSKREGAQSRALELLERSVRADPRNAVFHNNLGGVQRQLGRLEDARRSFERAIVWQAHLAAAHYNLGLTLRSLGNPTDALVSYRRAITYQPHYIDAMFQAAGVLEALGQPAEALGMLESVLAKSPGHREACALLAKVAVQLHAYERALPPLMTLAKSEPDSADRLNDVGVALAKTERHEEAVVWFRQAIDKDPSHVPAWINLGGSLESLHQRDDAVNAYRKAVELDPTSSVARFNLAALAQETGSAFDVAPPDFITQLFDDYAEGFEFHLMQKLRCRIPQLLHQIVADAGSTEKLDILDLGCGTGLLAEQFKPMANTQVGVDLAPRMLAKAREKGLYRELIQDDVLSVLRARIQQFDLVVAGDLFIYIGKLDEIFPAVHAALRPGGMFAFSLEADETTQDFLLRPTRRYAHAAGYIQRLSRQHGFVQQDFRCAELRTENGVPVGGYIVLLRKESA